MSSPPTRMRRTFVDLRRRECRGLADIVVGGATREDVRVLTSTNTFQHDFLKTRGELIDYESACGKKLQGALFYPADNEPGRVYPMIVLWERSKYSNAQRVSRSRLPKILTSRACDLEPHEQGY